MDWHPSPRNTHVEFVPPDERNPGSLLIEHFNDPYEAVLDDDSDASLHGAANLYLRDLAANAEIGRHFALPERWLAALAPDAASRVGPHYFGWVPVERDAKRDFDGPHGSLRFRCASDHLVVLFASERLALDHYMGSGFGLSVATHIRHDTGTATARFTGIAAVLPYGRCLSHPISEQGLDAFAGAFASRRLYGGDAAATMAEMANLERVAVLGVRIAATGEQWWMERRGVGVRVAPQARCGEGTPLELPYAVTMRSIGGKGIEARHTITHLAPLVAHGTAPVCLRDPCSVLGRPLRPTCDEQADPPRQPVGLAAVRARAEILPPDVHSGPLQYPPDAERPLVRVMRCPRFVAADRPGRADAPRHVTLDPGGALPMRSDDASAIQAFFHARDLVQRLEAYGWPDPATYFRVTAPEVKIFYRSGVSPGPGKDGRTVNARVFAEGESPGADGMPRAGAPRPAIQVHLASADLRRRERQKWIPGGPPAPAVPFGIATDQRWMWHEFGHVLLLASTGEPEFRFAHSPGDALAAIVGDPDSKLPRPLGGMTFPFVFLPRRHDRSAQLGWSWTGPMQQALQGVADARQPRSKGYRSEQILSSSLFRLYRCMGGDTRRPASIGDDHERRRASHYALYLIMQAMQAMGDARLQATSTPAKFVHWLRQADLQTGEWTAAFPPLVFRRVGGTLGKVIRWAFEKQGLYGKGDGAGAPEQVDIYIEDCRPTRDDGEAEPDPGGYAPVSLHWQPRSGPACGDAPAWQAATDTGIVFDAGEGRAEVRVGNRGCVAADQVTVSLWFAEWQAGTLAPLWSATSGNWTPCEAAGPATRNVPPGPPSADTAFVFRFAPAPGVYLLFAQATCADDRANTDPALSLACSYVATPMVDLVPHDNNLGLRVVVA